MHLIKEDFTGYLTFPCFLNYNYIATSFGPQIDVPFIK